MRTLFAYMRKEVDVSGWRAERLIREINCDTSMQYNEHLERYYTAMNSVDRYVVDNYRLFERGVALDDIDIKGNWGKVSLGRLLMKTCNHTRVRLISYLNAVQRASKAKSEKVSVYTIKSRSEIKEYWDVIDYVHRQVE